MSDSPLDQAKTKLDEALAAQKTAAEAESKAQDAARATGRALSKARNTRIEAARLVTVAQHELNVLRRERPLGVPAWRKNERASKKEDDQEALTPDS